MSLATAGFTPPALGTDTGRSSQPSSSFVLRGLLLGGCFASAGLAAWAGDPSVLLRADAELAFLLRGMAAIKAALVLAALAVLWWRFGHAVSQRTAAGYVVGACLISGATTLVWQLSDVPLAALAFHAGEFLLLFAAWGEHRQKNLGRAFSTVR